MEAAENWMLATPELLPAQINHSNSFQATPWLSPDGLSLYFSSDRPGGYGEIDLWVADRNSVDDPWNTPTNLGPTINTARSELSPCLSADGLTLYFEDGNPYGVASRAGGPGNYQIWMATRAARENPWNTPTDLGPPVGSSGIDDYPHLAADGLNLYFTSMRSGLGGLYVANRAAPWGPWLTATNLGTQINQGSWTAGPCVSTDGLRLVFYSDRSGGRGGFDLWMSTRSNVTAAWPAPINLGAQANGPYYEVSPCVSADFPALGSYVYFARNNTAAWNKGFQIYRAEVIPNLTLLRSSSASGPWTPVTATFARVSENSFQTETTVAAESGQWFYRMMLTGNEGEVRISSSAKFGNKFRIEFDWVRLLE
jgi:hypothetical protein